MSTVSWALSHKINHIYLMYGENILKLLIQFPLLQIEMNNERQQVI